MFRRECLHPALFPLSDLSPEFGVTSDSIPSSHNHTYHNNATWSYLFLTCNNIANWLLASFVCVCMCICVALVCMSICFTIILFAAWRFCCGSNYRCALIGNFGAALVIHAWWWKKVLTLSLPLVFHRMFVIVAILPDLIIVFGGESEWVKECEIRLIVRPASSS